MGTCSENRKSVPELFGSSVFNDDVMQERLPKDVYRSLRKTIDEGKDLDLNVANAVANAMKDWGNTLWIFILITAPTRRRR